MRKALIRAILFILLLSACASAPATPCGDGTCSGPENAQNCPQDCTSASSAKPEENKPAAQSSSGDLRKSLEITVTTDTTGKGYGMTTTAVMTLDLSFPAEGGPAALTMGSARITDYTWEEIPGCVVNIPSDLIGTSVPITFKSIEYYPDGFMILNGPVTYDQSEFSIGMDCVPTGLTTIVEYPFAKTIAVFNEDLKTLSFRPEQDFDNTLKWGTNDVWNTQIVIAVK